MAEHLKAPDSNSEDCGNAAQVEFLHQPPIIVVTEMTDAEIVVRELLEGDDDEDWKEVTDQSGTDASTLNQGLFLVLRELGVPPERISTRYSDVYIMCATHAEASRIAQAGDWRSMAEVVRTNPDHPDAKQWPWLCDIPFANLGAYIGNKGD